MPDKFDPYREALIIETTTVWPEELDDVELSDRDRIGESLHANPADAANLEYVRLHTGFCRQITVTPEEYEQLRDSG